jgi:hypothetical protein
VAHILGLLGPPSGGGCSGGPDHEPGRWGLRGTHVSRALERCVGAMTLECHDEVVELSRGGISSLAADLFVVLPTKRGRVTIYRKQVSNRLKRR